MLEYGRNYRNRDRERFNALGRARAAIPRNKEKKRIRSAKYREKNREVLRAKFLEYYALNKGVILPKMSKTRSERKKTDISYKLGCVLRTRVFMAVKSQSTKKIAKTEELIGCSVAFLKTRLESMFKPGMCWQNHSFYGWHIDHIIPIAAFDLTDPEQQRKCFHYTNLQPLWAKENLIKNASWTK